jgi:hypothetical protein
VHLRGAATTPESRNNCDDADIRAIRIFDLQIRMVAGVAEAIEREEILVAGVGFEPTTSGL